MSSMGRRAKRAWPVTAVAVLVLLSSGCAITGAGDEPATDPMVVAVSGPPEIVETTEAPEPEPEPTPTKTRSKKPKPKPKPSRTEDPNNFQEPECATHEGKKVSKAAARSALNAAAAKIYWPAKAPELKLSGDLVRSVSWHESGWQSDIVNCDGGRGLMQVMPETTDMINNRFGEAYDAHDHRQNALVGANYLAWLTKYFGEKFFKNKYDLSTGKCRTNTSPCLLNLVIAGYNAGHGAVEESYRADKSLPNPEYVDSVRSLMRSCYCDRY